MEFKEFLRKRRIELKLSQVQVAERLSELGQETSSARVGHWETGRNGPPLEDPKFPKALAAALGMDTIDLMTQLGYIATEEDRSPQARRAAGIIDRLPEEIKSLALEFLAVLEKRYGPPSPELELEVAVARLEEAESLVSRARPGNKESVSAVLLAQVALDIAVRQLWWRHLSPTDELKEDDVPENLTVLITDLQKAGVLHKGQASQLKFWVELISRAVHGQKPEVQRRDIETMLEGIRGFISDNL